MKNIPKRILSVDVFRAITMLLMVFVNDIDGVSDIPSWIKHAHPDADRMGFADVIFPAFLFIVGLSLPFAFQRRLGRDDSFYKISAYILWRSLALMIMGIFQVNMDVYNTEALPKGVWILLVTIGFFLIWLDYPAEITRRKRYVLQGLGLVILLLMAGLFKGGAPGAEVWFKAYWWGILGIIGWTYLVCAAVFLLSKGNFAMQIVVFLLFMLINIGVHAGIMGGLPVIGNAAYCALTMAGIVISILYQKLQDRNKYSLQWILLFIIGLSMLLFGFLIRPYTGGISKNHATPAWTAICIGISVLFFEVLIYLIDVRAKWHLFKVINPAGTSALTCYLLPYFLYSVYAIAGFHYPDFFNAGPGGILRSFAVAFFLVWLTGLLEKAKLRLRL